MYRTENSTYTSNTFFPKMVSGILGSSHREIFLFFCFINSDLISYLTLLKGWNNMSVGWALLVVESGSGMGWYCGYDGPCHGQHDCVSHHYVQGLSKETDFMWEEKLKSARKRNTGEFLTSSTRGQIMH